MLGLDRSQSLPNSGKIKAHEWWQRLSPEEKDILEKMIVNHRLYNINLKYLTSLIAHRFCISHNLARELVVWRDTMKLRLQEVPEKSEITEVLPAIKLAKWEKLVLGKRHNYSDEVFK